MQSRSMGMGPRGRARLTVVLMAALGGTAGHLATRRPAAACSCAPFTWSVRLQAATSSDPSSTHGMFWPPEGTLMSYPGRADLWANTLTGGQVGRVGASR